MNEIIPGAKLPEERPRIAVVPYRVDDSGGWSASMRSLSDGCLTATALLLSQVTLPRPQGAGRLATGAVPIEADSAPGPVCGRSRVVGEVGEVVIARNESVEK